MGLRQIGYSFGLTKERRKELSDTFYENGKVASKDYLKWYDHIGTGLSLGNEMNILPVTIAIHPLMENEEFNISFKGRKTSFDLDDEKLFKAFKVGDKVRIAYQEKYKSTYNYVPPNFEKKQLVSRVLSEYKFVSAKKIK